MLKSGSPSVTTCSTFLPASRRSRQRRSGRAGSIAGRRRRRRPPAGGRCGAVVTASVVVSILESRCALLVDDVQSASVVGERVRKVAGRDALEDVAVRVDLPDGAIVLDRKPRVAADDPQILDPAPVELRGREHAVGLRIDAPNAAGVLGGHPEIPARERQQRLAHGVRQVDRLDDAVRLRVDACDPERELAVGGPDGTRAEREAVRDVRVVETLRRQRNPLRNRPVARVVADDVAVAEVAQPERARHPTPATQGRR